jgi:hypothetical protein
VVALVIDAQQIEAGSLVLDDRACGAISNRRPYRDRQLAR